MDNAKSEKLWDILKIETLESANTNHSLKIENLESANANHIVSTCFKYKSMTCFTFQFPSDFPIPRVRQGLLKPSQNKNGQKIFYLPAVKKDIIFSAARKFFGFSYFVTALAVLA